MNHNPAANTNTNSNTATAATADNSAKAPLESRRHQEALLDEAVADSFPASDPIAPAVQARLEPADVSQEERFTNQHRRFSERVRRAAPSLIAIGTAAVALLALQAIRNSRAARREQLTPTESTPEYW